MNIVADKNLKNNQELYIPYGRSYRFETLQKDVFIRTCYLFVDDLSDCFDDTWFTDSDMFKQTYFKNETKLFLHTYDVLNTKYFNL